MSNDKAEKAGGCCQGPAAGHAACPRSTERPEELKKSLAARLARIEGQVRGVRRMIEADVYCDDVLAQISAARAALDRAALLVLEHHMKHCLIDHVRAGDDGIVDEIMDTLSKFL